MRLAGAILASNNTPSRYSDDRGGDETAPERATPFLQPGHVMKLLEAVRPQDVAADAVVRDGAGPPDRAFCGS
jgi:hypothetical protein